MKHITKEYLMATTNQPEYPHSYIKYLRFQKVSDTEVLNTSQLKPLFPTENLCACRFRKFPILILQECAWDICYNNYYIQAVIP